MEKMKRGLGVFDGSTSPARVWTLVVHNDFSNFGDDSRISDKEDVKILRDEFSRRNCEFRELASKSKDEILGVLNQENKLYEIFGADEKAPEAFVLFVLSHGTSDGRIYTDHLSADSSVEESKYEHYFTSDVWNGLHEKNMPKLSNCLKILVFGSCRGPNSELRLMKKTLNDCVVGSKSMWITAKPNSENFVILYSTVEGGGAMHIAAENDDLILMNLKRENLKAVKFLLGIEGVEIDAKDATDSTPLMLAVEGNHSAVVKYLSKEMAARSGERDLDIIFKSHPPDKLQRGLDEALCDAVDGGHVDLVMDLFERGAVVSKCNKNLRSPLGVAIERNREELVRLLLSLMSHEDQAVAASSALIIAVQKGNLEIVNLLVKEFGADINVRDDSGNSAILLAFIYCESRIIDYLLKFEHLDLVMPSNNGSAPVNFLFHIQDQEVQKRLERRIKVQMKTRELMGQGDL
ncbi:Hypothetical predicted protein [Cloeon dipterum]|uniref:Caspase family p20 domain-containing protein n=1 Tax=Cloeon dipterum TaxID=197152 RepID=A0A8S1DDS4_9INSE|nr:Hypothetical predicted protein [Cloeon dipterum]